MEPSNNVNAIFSSLAQFDRPSSPQNVMTCERGDYDVWNWNVPAKRKLPSQIAPRFAKLAVSSSCDLPSHSREQPWSWRPVGHADSIGQFRNATSEMHRSIYGDEAMPLIDLPNFYGPLPPTATADNSDSCKLGSSDTLAGAKTRACDRLVSLLVSGITGNVNVVTFAQYLVDRDINFLSVLLARHRCASGAPRTNEGELPQTMATVSSEKYAFVDFDNLDDMRCALRKLRDAPFHGGKLHAQVSERTKLQLLGESAKVKEQRRSDPLNATGIEAMRSSDLRPFAEPNGFSGHELALNASFDGRNAGLSAFRETNPRVPPVDLAFIAAQFCKLLEPNPVDPSETSSLPDASVSRMQLANASLMSMANERNIPEPTGDYRSVNVESVWNTLRDLFED